MDDDSDTTVHDLTSYANDGSMNGGMDTSDYVSGKWGNALDFDGTDYVEVSDDDSLDIEDQITLSAWVRPAQGGYVEETLLEKHSSNWKIPYRLERNRWGGWEVSF
ncbi:hypothetical protein AKJ55_01475 [candidate division MSBL1 archaeon SCGC-AAA382M17]|uniref:Uncharacterized protein n=1 Tax=candidate division MSBL1 archaeon SCGC-AAA382M17 TaxID=1698284 RepID=A0ABR5TJC6_9EURY|nr:hypothetical protein AKJ55_01475 [candidate division MSBL1 archaeon SCGC-AAA382M17]